MKVKLAGGEIAFDVHGRGTPLLLLHAFPLSRAMWEPQVEALQERLRLVRFDVRGLGESPPGGGILTMERIADDAAGLLDHLGLSRAVVCGLSMGGYAAFALARRHPERLLGLVLADTRAAADTPEARAGRAELGERIRRGGARVAAEALVPKLLGPTSLERRPEVVERVRAMIESGSPAGICDALAGIAARADATPALSAIAVPTLVLCGEEDALTPPADSRALAGAIPGARLEILPDAGHLANLETPEPFSAALGRFAEPLG